MALACLALHANITVYTFSLIVPTISFIFVLKRWDEFKDSVDNETDMTEMNGKTIFSLI
jgi:hypothetical protein